MKRRMGLKKLVAAVAAGSLLLGTGTIVHAEGLTAAQLQRKFPNGAFWNHVTGEDHDLTDYNDTGACNDPDHYTWHECTSHIRASFSDQVLPGVYHCNSFAGTIECYGFAAKLASDVYGDEYGYFEWMQTVWTENEEIKPGDVVFYYGAGSGEEWGHRAMVIDTDGSRVCVAECNWYKRCMISWGRWFDLADTEFCIVFSAPYELPGGGDDVLIDFKKGDIDENGSRQLIDAQACLKEALHLNNLDEIQQCAADMDGDGTVTLQDAQFLLKVALNIVQIE